MLMNISAVMPAMAMNIEVGSGYTFVDTAYSPELDIYLAVARNSGGTAKIYYSNGGETWQASSQSFSMLQYVNANSQQNVVWWPKEQVFIAYNIAPSNERLRWSKDGATWTDFSRSGSNYLYEVSGDGQQLAVMRHALIALDSMDEGNMSGLPDVDLRNLAPDNQTYAVGVSDTAPYIYAVFRQQGNGMRISAQPITPTPTPAPEAELAEADSAEEPAVEPTAEPVIEPTAEPVTEPTAEPVAEPTAEPVAEPTAEPVAEPTAEPVAEPTEEPVTEPTEEPVAEPTAEPVAEPTAEPEPMTAEAVAEPVMSGVELMAETVDYSTYRYTDVACNLSRNPIDAVWSKPMGGWFVIDGAELTFVKPERTTGAPTATVQQTSAISISDGQTISDESFTAASTNDDSVIVGTEKGNLYIAPATEQIMTSESLAWDRVEPGDDIETEISERVRSISKVNDNAFFFATDTGIYIASKDNEGSWQYHDPAKTNIIADADETKTRIEVPKEGSINSTITPEARTWAGTQSQNTITDITINNDAMPAGVNAEVSGDSINVTVDSTVDPAADNNINVTVTAANGQQYDFDIIVASPDHPEAIGYEEMLIPPLGSEPKQYQYSAVMIGTDGEPMETYGAYMEVDTGSMPAGVTFDPDTGIFTVTDETTGGSVTLYIYSEDSPENSTVKEIALSESRSVRAEMTLGPEELQIPDDEALQAQYKAEFYNQIDELMLREQIDWSVEIPEGSTASGVSIDDKGILNVLPNATLGMITVKAASHENPEVMVTRDVELTYTDRRMATEDLNPVTFDTSKPLEDDLELITTGATYGSTISYTSSDENVLRPDGTVIRPSREDGSVILTATSTLNTGRAEKKWEFVVKKADNLCVNGDLEDGTYNGWSPINDTVLEIVQEDDSNALKATGEGAYQTLTLTDESSYGFEARVKAPEGTTIKLVSETGGTIAELTADGDYQDLKGSYDYRRQDDSFEDKIYIECSGEMTVDELKVYEITLELADVMNAVNRAVYSKEEEDIDKAKELLDGFYDLPIKEELLEQLDDIEPNRGNNNGGGGGGGGGGTPPSSSGSGSINNITIPPKGEDNYEDILDTYLLTFKDMKNHWAREDVEYMAELGIIQGKSEDQFMPEDNISRAEFAALITRTMGLSETPYENSFYDVVSEDWYSGYVQTVRSNNFMNGYDGLFNPNSPITREEIAKVIVAAYNSKTGTALETGKSIYFNDIDQISYWAWDYVAEAVDLGFINGVSEELFAPKEIATRAQAAVMLRRAYDKMNPSAESADSETA